MKTIRITPLDQDYENVVNANEILILKKDKDTYLQDQTVIEFKDGKTIMVEESMNTLEARLNLEN